MPSSAAARRYARALFQIAKEDRRVSEIHGELDALASLLQDNNELSDALLTPLHPVKERKAVLSAVARDTGVSPAVCNFYSYLIDQRRLVEFFGICEEYKRLANEDAGLVTAVVTAASPLDERRKDRLRRALSERTGQEVQLDIQIDPNLIGGAIAEVGGMVFDGSLRAQLHQLRANLTKES
ncbi:MAG: ATP synthase F1 subunit delta [bacterium]|nr:ATP synthase F1 subunit delta [bacterium]